MITSVPVGGVRAGYLRWCWALRTLATPPFSGTLFPLVAPPSGYKLPFPRYGTFKSVKNAKCVSRERKVVETRGQVWRVQGVRIMSDGSHFQVSTTYGSGVMGVESSAIETNGVSELLKVF